VIKAIETSYKGYRFRSRLEARWAVFFDAAGIKWEYEPEGFDIDGTLYLPDFRLRTATNLDDEEGRPEDSPAKEILWLEIKPTKYIPDKELEKCAKFAAAIRSIVCCFRQAYSCRLLILAGNCGNKEYAFIDPLTGKEDHDFLWCECPLCHRIHPAEVYYGSEVLCDFCDYFDRNEGTTQTGYFYKGDTIAKNGFRPLISPRLVAAFTAARSARFDGVKQYPAHVWDGAVIR
jgi:hypothetical protein